jgi:hypothetical protein
MGAVRGLFVVAGMVVVMNCPAPAVDHRHPADMVTAMVDRVFELAATWSSWDGAPIEIPRRGENATQFHPHTAVRRVADRMVDHLAELDVRLGGAGRSQMPGTGRL